MDIWSCGVILYAMICGSLPFDDEHLAQLFAKIKKGNYHLPRSIPRDAKDLIQRMLQTNPVKRIKLSEIKRHRWFVQDLPPYLQQISRTPIKNENEVDLEIVKQKMLDNELSQAVCNRRIERILKEKYALLNEI